MEYPDKNERWKRAGVDDNLLAMFDASDEAKDAHQDTLDDSKKNIFFFVFFIF